MTGAQRACALAAAIAALAALGEARAGPAACKVEVIATLPVVMDDLKPKIRARINGVDASFLVDSGAFYSMITPASAAEFHLSTRPTPPEFYVVGLGGDATVSIATVRKFNIAGVDIPGVQFLVGGSEVGNDGGGLIGQNFLGIADVEYDLAGGVVRLLKPRGCGDRAMAYWAKDANYSVIDIEPLGEALDRKTMGTVHVDGIGVKAQFDSGADTSTLSRRVARKVGIDLADPRVEDVGYGSGLGRGRFRNWIVPIDVFKIGDEEIRHTRLTVADAKLDDTDDGPDMLLGADFFLSHHIYVANSQHKLYFTYNGGPVFNLKASPAAAPPPVAPTAARTPADADALARRGTASAARGELAAAVVDLTAAIAAAPTEARYRFERAQADEAKGDSPLALADLDKGLELDPANPDALISRAMLRNSANDDPGALADADAAAKAMPNEADARFVLARLYETADAAAAAVTQYDLWIRAHPDDSKRPIALSGRCRARAMLGEALDQALADCNAAVRGMPRIADPLESRGLVYLRRGELDRAMADDQAALAIDPKSAWAMYGRGLAELRKGQAAQGKADIDAATALAPGLPVHLKARGIAP